MSKKRIIALDLETNTIHTLVEYDFKTGKCILSIPIHTRIQVDMVMLTNM